MIKSIKAANYLRTLRESYGRTQEEVANLAGIERTSYNRKENGKVTMAADEFLNCVIAIRQLGPKRFDNEISIESILKLMPQTE